MVFEGAPCGSLCMDCKAAKESDGGACARKARRTASQALNLRPVIFESPFNVVSCVLYEYCLTKSEFRA